jgi:galactokinase
VPIEMKQVASLFEKNVLRDVNEETFYSDINRVRTEAGDRAVLRALHFYAENRRVGLMAEALKAGDFDGYLRLSAESGASSSSILQNTIPPGNLSEDQPAALAIGASNVFFQSKGCGVARIHGGGFAGTIQAYVHKDYFGEYSKRMKKLFGGDCIVPLKIRDIGVCVIN